MQLLRLAEIMMNSVRQGGTGQLDDTLIAVGEIALIDGEGEMARTQQAGD